MKTIPSHPLRLLPGVAGAAVLTLALLAQAAETVPAKPALLTPKPAASAPPAQPAAAATPAKPRKNTRALGGDDDLKDLEVERVRGRNR